MIDLDDFSLRIAKQIIQATLLFFDLLNLCLVSVTVS